MAVTKPAGAINGAGFLPTPRLYLGETASRREVWSPRELDAVFASLGGVVSLWATSPVAVEVTLVTPDGITYVTEWEPVDHPEHLSLSVMQAASNGGAAQMQRPAAA